MTLNIRDFEFEYKRAKVTYKDWESNTGVGQVFEIKYPKYLFDLKNSTLNLHMDVDDSGWVGECKNTKDLTEEDFKKTQTWAKRNIDGVLKAYERLLTHTGSEKKLAVELSNGIYAIRTGAKSKWFKISPYQYRTRYFQADEVKSLSRISETQGLNTLIFDVPTGFDQLLIGIGDD